MVELGTFLVPAESKAMQEAKHVTDVSFSRLEL